MKSFSDSYKAAGVDVTAGYKAVELMKEHTRRTMIPGVLSGLGGFGGLFGLDVSGMKEPVLVSGTDGVGTKLRLAQLMDKHDTIGIDCVAMCVNDIVCCRSQTPVFPGLHRLRQECAGEDRFHRFRRGRGLRPVRAAPSSAARPPSTPGVMPDDDYDLAGFTVGVVDKEKILDQSNVKRPGDAIIALPSSGIHSNGFSLVRRVFDLEREAGTSILPSWVAHLVETLLDPHKPLCEAGAAI